MSAVLKRVDDPRSNLEKARRPDLVKFARANGLSDITENMPAILIRRRLVAANLTRIPVNAAPLGLPPGAGLPAPSAAEVNVNEIDAEADLERQFARETAVTKPASGINGLRAECKRLGIKLSRKDNMDTMKAKIQDHGKDAS